MTTISTILVAVDFSPNSDRALQIAIDFAKKFSASIDLVHGFALPVPAIYAYDVAIPDSLILESRRAAQQRLDSERAKVEAEGVDCRSHLTQAPAAPAIAQVAEELGSDLLILGTRGNTGLKHVLLGSVGERALHLAPCPVLVIK